MPNGRIEALPRFACPDWWERLQAGETPMAEVPVNWERASRALAFFNRLRLPDVAGNPPLKEACGDWFRDILIAISASEDPETHERLVWECLCMVPKKSSKSTYSAALALTELYLEEVPQSQFLLIGPSQNISERCFSQAQGMIRLDPGLEKIFHIQDNLKRITRRRTRSKLEVKTFDTSIVTGEIPRLTIIDELHELGKKAGAAAVMQQVRGGGITKAGGRLLMITTQSDKEPAGIWKAELRKARAIRDGQAGSKPIMLPVLYEFPEAVQKDEGFWRNRDNWHLVLPNLGRSISRERLEADYENNGSATAETEQIWVSQHLNVEIGLGLHSERWVGAEYWTGCIDDTLIGLEELLERSEVVVAGGDLGGADDLASLAFIGREADTRRWLHHVRVWATPDVLARRASIATVLRDVEEAGDLVIEENTTEHARQMAALCSVVREGGLFPEAGGIGLDPWGVAALLDELGEAGFPEGAVYGVGQGFKLNGAIKGLERRLMDGRLLHGDQPIMRWALGNAKAEAKGNNIMITKAKAGVAKIDPLIATFNAAVLMDMNPVASSARSYLETADLMVL
ncbi:terminase large subunit [Maritimibacter alexandrii]|uniref:terminase large subunit n=1 Tax=Maritimibacter alexandrii TaxID=2570355 RepID=UPI001F3C3B30|nr:terminase TerL endonuclease subunit [Maritimibacter alexandrii]